MTHLHSLEADQTPLIPVDGLDSKPVTVLQDQQQQHDPDLHTGVGPGAADDSANCTHTADSRRSVEDDEEEQLRMRRLRAEVRKLEAEADRTRAEADGEAQRRRLLQLDVELKELQIMKLKKELGILKNGRVE